MFGASGYVGSHLVTRLLEENITVRASARNLAVLQARDWPASVERVESDALDPPSLKAALEGVEVAYYLVHSMAAGKNFHRIDLEAAQNFAQAAAQAGVRRIIYLGGLLPDGAESEHMRSRQETGQQLRRGSVPVTELLAGIIIGPGSAAFEVMRDLVLHLPLMVTPRWVRSVSPPIALDNLLEYLVAVAWLDEAAGGIYDAAGPELVTYHDMMLVLAEVAGKAPPRVIPVPVLTPQLSSYWLGLITAVPANIAKALISGLKHDLVADDSNLRTLVPQQLLGVRAAIKKAFEIERSYQLQSRWKEGAFSLRDFRHDVAFYAKKASGFAETPSSPEAVWRQVCAIGGENRYYYANALWWLRELLDWLVGGPGFSKGRRHPTQLRLGDAIDHWTVIGLEPQRRLTLHFGMKAPGAGVLEFELMPISDGGTRLTITAYWHPKGVWGLLYWYSLVPAHLFIFKGLTRAIVVRAEKGVDPLTGQVIQRAG